MALCHSHVTLMLCTDINITETTYSCQFQYVFGNKWVIAVKVSNFSGQYLRNHWTLDIGVLGYIGIVWPKEHSPEVRSFPPGTPCTSRNFMFSICFLTMLDTLFLRPSLHSDTSLHFTTLHPTTLHYTLRYFTFYNLNFTTLSFGLTHQHFLPFCFTSHH